MGDPIEFKFSLTIFISTNKSFRKVQCKFQYCNFSSKKAKNFLTSKSNSLHYCYLNKLPPINSKKRLCGGSNTRSKDKRHRLRGYGDTLTGAIYRGSSKLGHLKNFAIDLKVCNVI